MRQPIEEADVLRELLDPFLPPPRPCRRPAPAPVRTPRVLAALGLALTRHAAVRMQQRGIRAEAVAQAVLLGSRHRSGDATVHYLGRRALGKLPPELRGSVHHLHGVTVVVGDEGVVRTVWRNRRGCPAAHVPHTVREARLQRRRRRSRWGSFR